MPRPPPRPPPGRSGRRAGTPACLKSVRRGVGGGQGGSQAGEKAFKSSGPFALAPLPLRPPPHFTDASLSCVLLGDAHGVAVKLRREVTPERHSRPHGKKPATGARSGGREAGQRGRSVGSGAKGGSQGGGHRGGGRRKRRGKEWGDGRLALAPVSEWQPTSTTKQKQTSEDDAHPSLKAAMTAFV